VQPTNSYTRNTAPVAGFRHELLTTREVAALLGLSPATVLRRARAGELPSFRLASNVLRFSADEVAAWLEARRTRR
jgi:excisionase family DNA binding protein